MKLPVIILGAGGHARVLIDTLQALMFEIIGITVPDASRVGKVSIRGIHVIGTDIKILEYEKDKVLLVNGLGSVKTTALREEVFKRYKNIGYSFADVIHPSAIISSDVQLFEGVQVMAGAVIQTGSRVGANSIINTRAAVDHDCIIGDHVHIAPGSTLSGGVTIEDGVHIGTGATIIQGMNIGQGSLVAAGAVVTKPVRQFGFVAGVPAREV